MHHHPPKPTQGHPLLPPPPPPLPHHRPPLAPASPAAIQPTYVGTCPPARASHAHTHQPNGLSRDHTAATGGRSTSIASAPPARAILERHPASEMSSQDTILQAIDRLGQRMDTQLSRLAFQVSSMQAVVEHLVEQQHRSVQLPHPPHEGVQASLSTSWQQQQQQQQPPQQQHQYDKTFPPTSSPRSSVNLRRESEHPFAFDPLDDSSNVLQSATSHVPVPIQSNYRPSYQTDYPQHHQSNARGLAIDSERSLADTSDGSNAYMNPVKVESNGHTYRHSVTMNDGAPFGGTLSFQAGDNNGSDVDGRMESPNAERPESSYAVSASVRPFTAVDHSHRPQAASNHNGTAQGNGVVLSGQGQSGSGSTDHGGGVKSVEYQLQTSAIVPSSSYNPSDGHTSISSNAKGLHPSPRHGMAHSRMSPRQLAGSVGNGRFPGYSTEEASAQGSGEGGSSTLTALASHAHHRSLYTDSVVPSEQPFHPFSSQSYGPSSAASHPHLHHQQSNAQQVQPSINNPADAQRSFASNAHGHHGGLPPSQMNGSPASLPRKRQARLSSSERYMAQLGHSSTGGDGFPSNNSGSDALGLPRRKKREPTAVPARATDSYSSNSPDSTMTGLDATPVGPMGSYHFWAFSPPQPAENKLRLLPKPQFCTLQEARLDLQRKTGRTMAKLGRLPLKDYLEVSPQEYLHARKTGRAVYNEWLEPLVRMAKQSKDRVKACTNFIEYTHPMLAQCEGSFKARQLLQQIVDNAIDEATNARKKDGVGPGSGSSPSAWMGRATFRGVRDGEYSMGSNWSGASGDSDGGTRNEAGGQEHRLEEGEEHGRDHEGEERQGEEEEERQDEGVDDEGEEGGEGEEGNGEVEEEPERKRRRGDAENEEERDELEQCGNDYLAAEEDGRISRKVLD